MSVLFLLIACLAAVAPRTTDDHAAWNTLLERFVVDERWVDYSAWHADASARTELDEYLKGLADASPGVSTDDAALAYWINLYNALTVDLVLDHHPVDSIKDIGSPWKKQLITIDGRTLTLDDIEHKILRVRFDEPRIHFALNCASVSCPPLAAQAYTAAAIDQQLDAAARRALNDTDWLDVTGCPGAYGGGTIRVTKIFQWFQDDFGGREGVRQFLVKYRPEARFALQNSGCSLAIMDYDWRLNAPPTKRSR